MLPVVDDALAGKHFRRDLEVTRESLRALGIGKTFPHKVKEHFVIFGENSIAAQCL